jgi:superoxide dismutase, Cu-Zn family
MRRACASGLLWWQDVNHRSHQRPSEAVSPGLRGIGAHSISNCVAARDSHSALIADDGDEAMNRILFWLALSAGGVPRAGDLDMTNQVAGEPAARLAQSERYAKAVLLSAPNYQVLGSARFAEVREGVRLRVEVSGVPPGYKGIHVHETKDCSDIPNQSMGGHFSPRAHKHGLPEAPEHHLGDLGNILIGPDGTGSLDIVSVGANLRPEDTLSFMSRSLVLHERSDNGDGASGDAGKPIACAPIQ